MTLGAVIPTPPVKTGPVVGIIGGGQLARMCHQAAIPLGVELLVLCSDPEEAAGTVVPGAVSGEATDPGAVRALAARSDVLTVDHELVDLELLTRIGDSGTPVRPSPEALTAAIDKAELRRHLAERSIPLLAHLLVEAPIDRGQVPDWPEGWVVKTARGGYDGRGVWFPSSPEEVVRLAEELTDGGHRVIIERRVTELVEVAVLVARRPNGETRVYDPVRTFQRQGICVGLEAPAGIEPTLDRRVRELAESVAIAVGAVGVFAVEFLVAAGEPFVSEVAARPHNSGHHTIEAATTSQFENHLRAILDLPLGSPELRVAGVGMANLLGADASTDPRSRLREALAVDSDARIHLYGKRPAPGRKLGHVTVIDPDPGRGRQRAARVVAALGGRNVDPEEVAR